MTEQAIPDFSGVMPEDDNREDKLEQLIALAEGQKVAEEDVIKAEATLKAAQTALRDISEVAIPELMDDLGMEEFGLSDGSKVKKQVKIRASIPAANKLEAFRYLEDHEAADLITRKFEITFGKEDEKWAKKFAADLRRRKKPVPAKAAKAVHPGTLSKWICERLEDGDEIPMQLFGAFRQTFTKITLPKKGGRR